MLGPGSDAVDHDVIGHSAQLVRLEPTLVRLSSSRPGAPEGEPLTLAAQVRTLGEQGQPPTGSVHFRIGTRALGTAPLDRTGQAVLSGIRLAPGVHAITASYPGDSDHAAATSAPLPQAVTVPAMPVVVLVCAPCHVAGGLLLEAELVDPRTGRLAEDADGEIAFLTAGTAFARAALVNGHARVVVPALPTGRIAASFPGDPEHAAATGFLLEQGA